MLISCPCDLKSGRSRQGLLRSNRTCNMDETTDFQKVASQLCAQCGMCCNGVLFDEVQIQDGDSPRALTAMGLKLRRRGKGTAFAQPCPAHGGGSCSIYDHRPVRCRAFVCRQLRLLENGETSPGAALGKIREAAKQVQQIRQLFRLLGEEREHKSFAVRLAAVKTPPLEDSPEIIQLRLDLESAMNDLAHFLRHHFRMVD